MVKARGVCGDERKKTGRKKANSTQDFNHENNELNRDPSFPKHQQKGKINGKGAFGKRPLSVAIRERQADPVRAA
jgi:hypothetical protein